MLFTQVGDTFDNKQVLEKQELSDWMEGRKWKLLKEGGKSKKWKRHKWDAIEKNIHKQKYKNVQHIQHT